MLAKKARNRLIFLSFSIIFSILIVFFVVKTLNQNLLYFKTPTDLNKKINDIIGKKVRLGGMVKEGSIEIFGDEIKFVVTDFENEIFVSFKGTVPNLFLENKGVVAEGRLQDNNYFIADRILAKHDENYMPPEIKKSLKKYDK